ncbi:zinc-binding dehydrogenase [Streptomyces griseofuscus]|uniref:zinc-binding dehydrogenase n=1 Tax=Streptomyces griseofuscus TaxID=146922 RepID=UPI00118BFF35|nr:hypothetical protein SRO_2022 [Streptomyces rochei]
MLQGLTAHYLTESNYPATRGETALVLSAAGGLGQHLVRLLSRRGARVNGTVSAPGKAAAAEAVGARHVIVRGADPDELTRRVLDLTGGRGVDVVYDGIGKDTFEAGLAALRPRGMSSWSVPPPGPRHRSTRVPRAPRLALPHRPTLVDHATDPEELTARAADVFRWLREGVLKTAIGGCYGFDRAGEAHADLQSGTTTGKLLLQPGH